MIFYVLLILRGKKERTKRVGDLVSIYIYIYIYIYIKIYGPMIGIK